MVAPPMAMTWSGARRNIARTVF